MNRGCRGNDLHQDLDASLVEALNSMRLDNWDDVDFGLIRMESLYKLYIGPIKELGARIPDAIFVYRPYNFELEPDGIRALWPLFIDHFYFLIEIGECDAGKWPDHNWLHIGFDGSCTFRVATTAEQVKDCDIVGGGQDAFLEYAIGRIAEHARGGIESFDREIRRSLFKQCSNDWRNLGGATSLRRMRDCQNVSFYLSDGAWVHACGECNDSDYCNCTLCQNVHDVLTAQGVFND